MACIQAGGEDDVQASHLAYRGTNPGGGPWQPGSYV
jgi:hypothetical protein